MFKRVFLIFAILFAYQDVIASQKIQSLTRNMLFQNGINPYVLFGSRRLISEEVQNRIDVDVSITKVVGDQGKQDLLGLSVSESGTETEKGLIAQKTYIVRIKVASLFRDNIIRAFGYILHRNEMELNSDLYTSLYFILNTIKLNEVNIINMVSILSELSFMTSNERFLKIFASLETNLPEYLKGAAIYWKEAIENNRVNLDVIFRPTKDGPLMVDILDGMTKEVLDMVNNAEATEDPENKQEEKTLFNFNINILQLMRSIQSNKDDINQIFFGALLEYFPRSLILPNLEESIKVVIQYLVENPVEEWNSYFSDLPDETAANPYELVQHIINKLIENKSVPNVIKDSLQVISANLFDRNPTAINPQYGPVAQVVSLEKIDIQHMLKYIGVGAFPKEIVMSAQRVSYYLFKGYIRHLSLMLYINPYYYSSLPEIFIAILNRVIKRQPDLSLEILDSAGAVYSYLITTYRYLSLPVVMPDDLQNINLLILGIRAPDISKELKGNIETIISALQETTLDYSLIITNINVYKCPTPVLCFLELLVQLNGMELEKPDLKDNIPLLVNSNCSLMTCPLEFNPGVLYSTPPPEFTCENENGNDDIKNIEQSSTTPPPTPTETTQSPPTTPTEGRIQTPTTLPPTSPTTPTAPPSSTLDRDISTPEDMGGLLTPVNPTRLIEIVKKVGVGQDDAKIRFLIELVKTTEFQRKLAAIEENGEKMAIPTIVGFIMTLKAQKNEPYIAGVTDDEMLVRFRLYIDQFIQTLTVVKGILAEINTEAKPSQPILTNLIIAVKAPQTDEEKVLFAQLKEVLNKDYVFGNISQFLVKNDFKNSGTLLEAVLKSLFNKIQDLQLSQNEANAVEYYLSRVEKFGFSQGKISYGVTVEQSFQEINVGSIMDRAITFSNLENEERQQFNTIVTYLSNNRAILENWNKWLFYQTCYEFTTAMFKLILKQPSVPAEIREAINRLRSKIHSDGTALENPFEKARK